MKGYTIKSGRSKYVRSRRKICYSKKGNKYKRIEPFSDFEAFQLIVVGIAAIYCIAIIIVHIAG